MASPCDIATESTRPQPISAFNIIYFNVITGLCQVNSGVRRKSLGKFTDSSFGLNLFRET